MPPWNWTSCMSLLGEQHYMYPNLKARKLFMNAMSYTWALNENTYNISMRPTVIKSIQLLEESSELEPNVGYTLSQLLEYFTLFVCEYEKKLTRFFKNTFDLRPNDFSAKYSLGLIYSRLKQYDKAEKACLNHCWYPDDLNIKLELTEVYWQNK